MAHKYMVLKLSELRTCLTPEEQEQFNLLMQKLNAVRAEKDPNYRPPHYFVLNMKDKFSLPAVETYVTEIDYDDANRTQVGVRQAREAAWNAREWAITNTDGTKVPT
jgi:hypothetical protein